MRAGQAALIVFLCWLYGGDLVRAARLAQAPFAAMVAAPEVWLAGAGLAVAALGLAAFFRPWRGRFVAASAALLLFDLGVLWSGRPQQSCDELTAAAVLALADAASELATTAGVPSDPAELGRVAGELGSPPFFVKGEPRPSWTVVVKRDCAGPFLDASGLMPGTLIYCVAPGGREAQITAVTLSSTFGEPRIFATEKFVGVVRAPREDAADEPPPTMWDEGAPSER